MKATNNSLRENVPGVRIRVAFNEDFRDEYDAYVADPTRVTLMPAEYYKVDWLGFDGNGVTARSVPATASLMQPIGRRWVVLTPPAPRQHASPLQ